MEWKQSETLALANNYCKACQGYGLRPGRNEKDVPCNCVFRTIFRACYRRFVDCATREKYMSRVSLEFCRGKDRRCIYARKDEDYVADFCLVSRRSLEDFDYKVFRFHFLLGADWKLCCRQMKIDRGTFFHSVYRIQNRLGRIFRELEPYGLYPLDEYFGGTMRNARIKVTPEPKVVPIKKVLPFDNKKKPKERVPLLKIA